MTTEIKRWGNSLALRLSKDLSQTLGLKEGSKVEVKLSKGSLIISPKKSKLEDLLRQLEAAGPDPHGEIDWGEDVGKERF
jgi:antitoxin MazE